VFANTPILQLYVPYIAENVAITQ